VQINVYVIVYIEELKIYNIFRFYNFGDIFFII